MAPPFDFLERAFLPLVSRMGPRFASSLERYGFYPAGGGRVRLTVEPVPRLQRIELHHRGELRRVSARAVVADLPPGIAERELRRICGRLKLPRDEQQVEQAPAGSGPGNVVLVFVESAEVTEVFTGFGKRGVRAEQVAAGVASEAKRYLTSSAPVGQQLADQLLLPMALAGGGSFCTCAPSRHTLTNVEVIRRFLEVSIRVREGEGARGTWWIEVG
jgi:RNA 3'-terminal phosphate cyclase (ATP)